MTDYEKVIAVDPGGTAGVALGYPHHPDIVLLREYAPMEAAEAVEKLLEDARGTALLVVEKFTIDRRTLTLARDGIQQTIDSIGALRWLAHKHGAEWDNTQGPGDVKGLVTDARLKALGWWMPSKGGHANDAARHLARAMAKRKYLELPV